MGNTEKEHILSEIISTQSLHDYEAFEAMWMAMTKIAGVMTGVYEIDRQRMDTLFAKLSEKKKEKR